MCSKKVEYNLNFIWYHLEELLLNILSFFIADLQFSSEDEFDEVPFVTDDHSGQNEMETLELSEVREEGVVLADDDSQQAAEAMVQLASNVGFYVGEQQLLQQGKYIRSRNKISSDR